jgi:hypothetical protein
MAAQRPDHVTDRNAHQIEDRGRDTAEVEAVVPVPQAEIVDPQESELGDSVGRETQWLHAEVALRRDRRQGHDRRLRHTVGVDGEPGAGQLAARDVVEGREGVGDPVLERVRQAVDVVVEPRQGRRRLDRLGDRAQRVVGRATVFLAGEQIPHRSGGLAGRHGGPDLRRDPRREQVPDPLLLLRVERRPGRPPLRRRTGRGPAGQQVGRGGQGTAGRRPGGSRWRGQRYRQRRDGTPGHEVS